jgi:hypothetical protein
MRAAGAMASQKKRSINVGTYTQRAPTRCIAPCAVTFLVRILTECGDLFGACISQCPSSFFVLQSALGAQINASRKYYLLSLVCKKKSCYEQMSAPIAVLAFKNTCISKCKSQATNDTA